MEKTYITRRIDELGRFVIPKEIRKNLKIKDNDQLEINVMDNKIVLNKCEIFSKDKNISILLNTLRKYLNRNVLLTSRDSIIDYALLTKENIVNCSLSEEIINTIEKRNIVSNFGILNINGVDYNASYIIYPILINGDIYGSILIYGDNEVSEKDFEIVEFVNKFLENYLE